uniref:Uncharacterized protein n=1 Tax=Sphaerodactylus townsendi TaxID=933632 RepID=A0ACB8ET14_9SAUR
MGVMWPAPHVPALTPQLTVRGHSMDCRATPASSLCPHLTVETRFLALKSDAHLLHPALNFSIDSRETFLSFESKAEPDDRSSSSLDEEEAAAVRKEVAGCPDPPIGDQPATQVHQLNQEASPGNDRSKPRQSFWLSGDPALSQSMPPAPRASPHPPRSLPSSLEQRQHKLCFNLAKGWKAARSVISTGWEKKQGVEEERREEEATVRERVENGGWSWISEAKGQHRDHHGTKGWDISL